MGHHMISHGRPPFRCAYIVRSVQLATHLLCWLHDTLHCKKHVCSMNRQAALAFSIHITLKPSTFASEWAGSWPQLLSINMAIC